MSDSRAADLTRLLHEWKAGDRDALDRLIPMIMSIRVAPNLDPLRSEPRFRALLARSCRVPN
jgi:hypothetical protein